ncbi:hypothetical protein GCM10027048_42460 [Hymenobacter coalescens]
MNTFPRPAGGPLSAVNPVPAPATTPPQNPGAATSQPYPVPPQIQDAAESEEETQAKREFYAWYAGFEGYGCIF